MSRATRSGALWIAGLMASAWLAGCSSPQRSEKVADARPAEEAHHPATLEEAKALASERGVPILVDFYSPT